MHATASRVRADHLRYLATIDVGQADIDQSDRRRGAFELTHCFGRVGGTNGAMAQHRDQFAQHVAGVVVVFDNQHATPWVLVRSRPFRQRDSIPSRPCVRRGCVFKRRHLATEHCETSRIAPLKVGKTGPSTHLPATGRPQWRGRMARVRRKAPPACGTFATTSGEINPRDLARSLHRWNIGNIPT